MMRKFCLIFIRNTVKQGLTACVRDHSCFTVFRIKFEQNCVILKIQCNFGGIDNLCKLGTDMQIMHFHSRLLKLLTNYTPFYHQSLQKLSCDILHLSHTDILTEQSTEHKICSHSFGCSCLCKTLGCFNAPCTIYMHFL